MQPKKLTRSFIFGGIILVVLVILPNIVRLFTDWLWFKELGFANIFTTTLGAKVAVGLIVGLVTFALIYLNARIAIHLTRQQQNSTPWGELGVPVGKYINKLFLPIALLIGLFSGLAASGLWQTVLEYLNATPFNTADPIFNRDISYYFFTLPFIKSLIGFGFWIIIVSLIGAGFIYLARGVLTIPQQIIKLGIGGQLTTSPNTSKPSISHKHPARVHLLILAALIFLLIALKTHFVRIPELLYSVTGSFVGASYTDIHATLPLLRVISVVALVGVFLTLINIYRRKNRFILLAVGLYFIALAIGGVYPALVQKLSVVPNELAKETPYIEHNIAATQKAWGLDQVEKRDITGDATLTMDDINKNELTIKNVRLWDRKPLLDTFSQIQEIRTYYDFISVDNDRYTINDEYRQVMLSPRELNTASLPNKTFINERFTFTHGYGLALGPVNQVTDEGLPLLFVKDLPPTSTVESLKVDRPQIYYGELSSDYVFAKTKAQEFDYPEGEENVFTEYAGSGGVPINSLLDKAAFALRFGSLKILLSNDIAADSRVLFHRNIQERVKKVLPFLEFDSDPYLVVTEDGQLKWIYDAYTTGSSYPYAQAVSSGHNYMRNAVKIVIDAYDGKMQFYISDPDDPLIQTYAKIFPDTFSDLADIPADLKEHLRYPEDLFVHQTNLYKTYHMEQPQIFYNKEDQWEVPTNDNEKHDPIMRHLIMKLPGEEKEEFVLMLPFTPRKKDNMIAWMAARSDGDNYGKLVAYQFGKQQLVFGPKQINNRINQDADISQQISLWDQRGSEVVQGNLLVIPIEESLLYVRPLYIRAEGGKIPELKRVIVAYENKIAMEETLDQALQKIFAGEVAVSEKEDAEQPTKATKTPESLDSLADQAKKLYDEAAAAQRNGQWALYGEKMKELETILKEMAGR